MDSSQNESCSVEDVEDFSDEEEVEEEADESEEDCAVHEDPKIITKEELEKRRKEKVEADTDEEMDPLEEVADIVTESQILRPSFQDISPSFADEVPFLVDGDSLMITVMMDKNWSSQLGGSSLHLVYLFERYLNIFAQRGGTFHIVFFQSWRNVWKDNWTILLHRQILISHFAKNTEYPVHVLYNCAQKKFSQLVSSLRPGFILTNMELFEDCSHLGNIDRLSMKHLINIQLLFCLRLDLPCIDTNNIQVDITIVKGYYLDSNSLVKAIVQDYSPYFLLFLTEFSRIPPLVDGANFPPAEKVPRGCDIRKIAVLNSAALFCSKSPNRELVKLFFLTAALMEFLQLKNRCCPKFRDPLPELDEVVKEWQKCLFAALSRLEGPEFGEFNVEWGPVCDLWQGILFGHACRFASVRIERAEDLGPEMAEAYEEYVERFKGLGFEVEAYPVSMAEGNISWETNAALNVATDLGPLLPIQNPLVEEFCSSILHDLTWAEPPADLFPEPIYREEHHYHSMKVLHDEYDHVKDSSMGRMPDDPKERRRYQRNISLNAKYMTVYGSSIEGRPLGSSAIIRNTKDKKEKKPNKLSQKGQEIVDNENKKKSDKLEKFEKEQLDEIKVKLKKLDPDLEALLQDIDLRISKFQKENPNYFTALMLKLKVLLSLFENEMRRNSSRVDEIKKEIFLTVRTVFTFGSVSEKKHKDLLAKCLSKIDCQEIAKRNGLPVDNEVLLDDSWIRYQLENLGPELIRETHGEPDPRVKNFIPDPWQKKLFDAVDKRESALIVAPTSSGKTYASYYCMESVLREGTEGIVVYVAPTKALVNQVAATIYARFKDTKMPEGWSVYGVFTRDYRTNALNSQILVTVPQGLEILLMSPRRYGWVNRLRYVIFDEVHCIAGNIGGISWERCLLLIRCPFLALSATIRNPEGLQSWLQQAENYKKMRDIQDGCPRKSYRVNLVVHLQRHTDLTKFNYANGQLHHLHPYANLDHSVVRMHGGIPKHMVLSSKETMQLYDAMCFANAGCSALRPLDPERYFSQKPQNGFISRNLVQEYEAELSLLLNEWFETNEEDFTETINYLKPEEIDIIMGSGKDYIKNNIVNFILKLKQQNMLPVLVFAYDRQLIAEMTKILTSELQSTRRVVDRRTEKRDDKLEKKDKKMQQREAVKQGLETPTKKFKRTLNLLSGGGEKSLQGVGMVDSEEIKMIERRLLTVTNSKSLQVRGIRNGVAMHHAGLGNKMRSAVEMLYRKRVLNVVFATGTLAMGIHMPCKTTVIAGNSSFLNSLEYHQMSGRAGRRGYDTAGNVIFLGLNPRKQHSLLTAKLPDIKGNFPLNVSLVLRLLLLVSDSTDRGKKTEKATRITVSRVLTLLENSLTFTHDQELKMKIQHFFSFSLQFLKIQEFINERGEPLKWCGLATHIAYNEPGNLALVYLLRTGVFRQICTEIDNVDELHYTLVVILCHLFTNMPLDIASKKKFVNSKVILDPLPPVVHQALELYNQQVRFIFNQYFGNVAKHSRTPDNILPLSAIQIVGKHDSATSNHVADNIQNKFLNMCIPKLVCSSFSALSGNDDDNLYSADSLISNIKQNMATDVKVIPIIDLDAKKNGYALDFYRHEIVKSIMEDNGLKAGAEFALIKDFFLTLKTIVVSLEEMRIKDENDIVYKNFKMLAEKYAEKFNNAFAYDHY